MTWEGLPSGFDIQMGIKSEYQSVIYILLKPGHYDLLYLRE